MNNIVAIIGRPNVGKSTLFNRLTGKKTAIVHDTSGITRDRQYGTVEWNGEQFSIIDTGGFVPNSKDIFESTIRSQVKIAIEEAALILFIIDVTTGITDLDESLSRLLKKSIKPVVLVVNKVDNASMALESNLFYRLGMGGFFCIAAINGSGTGDLLDKIVDSLPKKIIPETSDLPKFAIVGRPNVGKSSFLNALIGNERNIVTDIAGTTRDAIHTHYKYYNKEFLLIDTAGIRKKTKVTENIEFYSVLRAIRAIEEADVCFIMMDATIGMETQDINIFRLAVKRKKGIVILLNKWDLIEKNTNITDDYINTFKNKLKPFTDLPILFISSLTKQRVFKAVEVGLEVYNNRLKKIPTSKLNDTLLKVINSHPPPTVSGKMIKIKYITQIKSSYPLFAFFCNYPQYVKEPYKRFLENNIRKKFPLTGVPITISLRKK